MKGIATDLTDEERARYQALVNFVRARQEDFRKVLDAVNEIQEKRLYRESYSSFTDFLVAELGIHRNQLDRLQRSHVNLERVKKHAPEMKAKLQTIQAINALESVPNKDIARVIKEADQGRPTGPSAREIRNAAIRLAVDYKPCVRQETVLKPRSSDAPATVPSADDVELALVTDAKRSISKFFAKVTGVTEQAAFIVRYYPQLAQEISKQVQNGQ
ncbi:MAG: hypothetical protein ACK5N9_06080 [Pirellula sp.]|jgi:hypothetical protein